MLVAGVLTAVAVGAALASPSKHAPAAHKPLATLQVPRFRCHPDSGDATRFALGPLTPSGRIDIVTADNDGTVSVILIQGHGKFAKPVVYKVSTHQVSDVAIADLNRDGKPDIVAVVADGTGATTFAVLLGNGNGTFRSPIVSGGKVPLAGNANFANSVAIGDFDGNGQLDAAVGFSPVVNDTDIVVYTGLGNGHFAGSTAVLPISNY